jgi:hypothetical protein
MVTLVLTDFENERVIVLCIGLWIGRRRCTCKGKGLGTVYVLVEGWGRSMCVLCVGGGRKAGDVPVSLRACVRSEEVIGSRWPAFLDLLCPRSNVPLRYVDPVSMYSVSPVQCR